jgi:hypothetical protein
MPLPYVWDYDLDENQFQEILAGRRVFGRLDQDWEAVCWVHTPPVKTYLADLSAMGESLLLLK